MNTPLPEKRVIYFPQGTQAQALLPAPGTAPDTLLSALALPAPTAVILLAGGAEEMEQGSYESLQYLFTHLALLAARLDALIIDGGTQAGVMTLMGEDASEQVRNIRLLGVSPEGKVTYPGKPTNDAQSDTAPLDPNHSHFVLVKTDEWGGETATMYALAAVLSQRCPSVAILVNGGSITKNEVLYNVRQHRPIVVVEGSGRLADEIAYAWRKRAGTHRTAWTGAVGTGREASPLPTAPAQGPYVSPPDAQLAEIIAYGDLHLFPLTGSLEQLEQLLDRLLRR
jgi:hypothetical protein